ncbi:MAG: hypothetical protein LBD75_04915 [Candidatus Peribacteria bacterium]|nr:hypothetical protein [Candidatus Peribacteria bacterium]
MTGQLTVAGDISLSHKNSDGYYDGKFQLYIDGVLVISMNSRYNNAQDVETKIHTGFVPIVEKEGYTLEIPTLPVGSGGTIELKAKITTGYQGQVFSNAVQISSDTTEILP